MHNCIILDNAKVTSHVKSNIVGAPGRARYQIGSVLILFSGWIPGRGPLLHDLPSTSHLSDYLTL